MKDEENIFKEQFSYIHILNSTKLNSTNDSLISYFYSN